MKISVKINLHSKTIFLALAWLSFTPGALAANNINVQTLTPSANLDYSLTESAKPLGEEDSDLVGLLPKPVFFFGATYNYLNDPLVELDYLKENRLNLLVNHIQTLDLTGAYEWNRRISLNVSLPVHWVKLPGRATENTLGDLRLFSKIYLNPESHGIRIAFIPELKLPTGSAELFVSDVSTGYGALVAVEKDFGFLSASINAGYRRSSNALFRNIDFRQQIPLGAGASIPVTHKLSANLEVSRVQSFPTDQVENPSEIYAGLRYAVLPGVSALGGASLGATNSASSGNYRVLVGLKYIPFFDRTSGLVVAPQIAPSVPAVVETPIKTTQAKAVFNPAEIEIRGDIKFQHNSAILKAQAKTILNDVAQVILENRANFELIEIQGHCNRLGPDLYNLKLSKRRAEAVKSYLVTKGVESNLLAARGFGKRIPKEPPPPLSPTQHLSADRRVQFKVIHAKAHTPG